jgi:hypothetical protein
MEMVERRIPTCWAVLSRLLSLVLEADRHHLLEKLKSSMRCFSMTEIPDLFFAPLVVIFVDDICWHAKTCRRVGPLFDIKCGCDHRWA